MNDNPAEIIWVALVKAREQGDDASATKLESLLDDPRAAAELLNRLQAV